MNTSHRSLNIIIVEDDEDDYLLIAEALNKLDKVNSIYWAKDGEEFLKY
jgi:CheY-like chemotaxis protein